MPHVERRIDGGLVRGITVDGVTSFLGLPYAASTAGQNRFRAPQPVVAWQGIRDALVFGPSAPQVDTRIAATASGPRLLSLLYPRTGSPAEGAPVDEDCLRVNIWAPSDAVEGALPVLVWLHGGGFTHGSGNEMAFNGDILAAAGNMVVVTVSHRLGLLGFLDLRAEGESASANAGMLDIVAALEWVQRNIAVFGGDPAQVTVCGQSGGSAKVATLCAMPRAVGLFHRAIMMSGPFARVASPEHAATVAKDTKRLLGARSVAELRSLPLESLLDAQAGVLAASPVEPVGDGRMRMELDPLPGYGPSRDADELPADPLGDAPAAGFRDRRVLIGWTAHEASMFLADDPTYSTEMTRETAAERVDVLAEFDGIRYEDLETEFPREPPHLLLARRLTQLMFEAPSRRLASALVDGSSGAWVYRFDQPTEVMGGLLGACHSLDLAYVFGTVDRVPLTGRDLGRIKVSRDMMRAWASFVRTGEPGWARWQGEEPHVFGAGADGGWTPPMYLDIAAVL